jgi:hypothetical protein
MTVCALTQGRFVLHINPSIFTNGAAIAQPIAFVTAFNFVYSLRLCRLFSAKERMTTERID